MGRRVIFSRSSWCSHSYILYAPLLHCNTTVLYEGKPVGTPDAGAFWRVISEHKVKAMFTAPTAFRAIKKEDPNGEFLRKYGTVTKVKKILLLWIIVHCRRGNNNSSHIIYC